MAVIEKLSEEEAYLVSILADESGLDQAEFLWYEPAHESTHGCFRAWPFQHKWWRDSSKRQIDQCLPSGSLVLTSEGHVPIQDVQIGDLVWTDQGRWRPVTWIFDRGEQEVVSVRGYGHTNFICTPDHKVYTTRGMVAASELKSERWLNPRLVGETSSMPEVKRVYGSGRANLPDTSLPEFAWLLGLYVAEGSTSSTYGKEGKLNRVTFSIHTDEISKVTAAIDAIGMNWNIDFPNENYKCANIRIICEPLARLVSEFGRGAKNKHLPGWCFGLPVEQRSLLMDGMLFGDGHERDGGFEYSTSSRTLAFDLKILATGLDCSSSVYLAREAGLCEIEGRAISRSDSWVTTVRSLVSQTKARFRPHQKGFSSPVYGVEPAGSAHCYDLEVEEDHSFVAEGVVVSNCARAVGKSTSLMVRACAFPLLHPGQEMLITAPEGNHMEAITLLIEDKLLSTRFYRELLKKTGANNGIKHRPITIQFLNNAKIMGRIPQRDGKGVKGCAAEGTPILTDRGIVAVEDLAVGDMVMTHKGRWRPVSRIIEDLNDAYEVRGAGSWPLTVSCDHRFYGVVNEAGPKSKRRFSDISFEDVECLEDFYWATPTAFPTVPVEPVEFTAQSRRFKASGRDFWWLVGRYLADGYTTSNGKMSKRVHWVVVPEKADDVTSRLERIGLAYDQVSRTHSSADIVDTCSTPLANWLHKNFGKTAASKTIPAFCLSMDPSDRTALLDGYLKGDGHWNEARQRWEAGTASQHLALGLQLLAQSLGWKVNCSSVEPVGGGLVPVRPKGEYQKSWRIQLSRNGHSVSVDDDRYLVGKVKSAERLSPLKVYDIVVEEDHSYLTGSIMSHNMHPIWLEMDESQDYPEPGWTELFQTLNTNMRGARWRSHGVTRGIRDKFFEFTQPDSGWMVHRLTAMHRPTWDDEERKEAIENYGSVNHPDYRRNILGEHGDQTNALFVLHRLMKCVDLKESPYNTDEYTRVNLSDEMIQDMGGNVLSCIDLPMTHRDYKTTWAGMDVGLCVDTETEILTQKGWTKYSDLRIGDRSLGINPSTGLSEWQDVLDIYRETFDSISMVHMKGQSFDSLTTPHHKWLTIHEPTGHLRWKLTRDLNSKDAIPLTVDRSDLPLRPTYDDDFVELVAWFWTEGWWISNSSAGLCQSERANSAYVERIRLLLKRLCGEPGAAYLPGTREIAHFWRELKVNERHVVDFHFRGPVVDRLRAVVDGNKVPSTEFLSRLTFDQLGLFIETSIDADGWRTASGARKIEQRLESGIRSFEVACALAGLATSTSYDAKRERHHLSILESRTVLPVKSSMFPRVSEQAMTVTETSWTNKEIWCPTVTHGNWLARRNGSVYFTGNTNHPSEILVFGEEPFKEIGETRLKLLSRLHLERVSAPDQRKLVIWLVDFYKTKAFCLDKTGIGLPIYQELQLMAQEDAQARRVLENIRGYNFSEKIVVGLDDAIDVDEFGGDPVDDRLQHRRVLEYASDKLREYVDKKRILLPDDDIVKEFQGQTWTYDKSGIDPYGRKTYAKGSFHALDAARMAILGHVQYEIEYFMREHNKVNRPESVLDVFIGG